MSSNIVNVALDKARKRNNIKTQQKKAEKKRKLYSASTLPKKPLCTHNSKTLKCMLLASKDLFYFHKRLYASASKIEQDNYLIKHMVITKVKRNRPRTGIKNPRSYSTKFYIPNNSTKVLVPVCKNTFLRATQLKSSRIEGVAKRHFITGELAKENRGGDRKQFAFASKREAVEKFIKNFKPLESHYCRGRIKVRQYLEPGLNIKKMYLLYDDQALPGFSVTHGFFRKIFNTRFNIGFGSPRQDVCSLCLELTGKLQLEKSRIKKQELRTQYRIHKLRAKQFYKMLQEETPGLKIFSFDCQKNLPLPKIPDQATYYARQLYFYNLTVVIGNSHTKLTTENVKAYVWTEDQAAKSSNEISSVVYHCINTTDFTGIRKIRLISDGCGGQNKNSIIVCMVMKWLLETTTKIKEVEIIFPVTGHSFMPADRVFALTERIIKKKENIIKPSEYENIIRQHASIYKLGSEVPIYDWKEKTKEFLKSTQTWHFQISKCKRIIFRKVNRRTVLVRGELSYRNDCCVQKCLTKRGKRMNELTLNRIPIGVPVKVAKLHDVNELLSKHFGNEWQNNENLTYYKNIITMENNDIPNDSESIIDPGDIETEEITDFV